MLLLQMVIVTVFVISAFKYNQFKLYAKEMSSIVIIGNNMILCVCVTSHSCIEQCETNLTIWRGLQQSKNLIRFIIFKYCQLLYVFYNFVLKQTQSSVNCIAKHFI